MAVEQPDPIVLNQQVTTSVVRDVAPFSITIKPSKFGYKGSEVSLIAGIGKMTDALDPDTDWKLFVASEARTTFAGTIAELETIPARAVAAGIITQAQADALTQGFLAPYAELVKGFNGILQLQLALGDIVLEPSVTITIEQ